MGTRGYKMVRHEGRFFVFLNEWDSYPAEFGQEIVDAIPEDEKGYQEWLTAQRRFFAKMTKEIENYALILDGKQVSDFLHIRGLDVERYPMGIVEFDADDPVEWTYTLDLDSEIFSVWDGAHFKLNKIPRDRVWIDSLKKDEQDRYTIDLEICPPECVASPEMERPRMVKRDVDELRATYASLEPRMVKASAQIANGRYHAYQCFHALTYVSFCETYFDNYSRYALRWTPSDFIFHELAFAVLSLAAGKVQFAPSLCQVRDLFCGDWKDYGKVKVGQGRGVDGEEFVPLFPVGSHIRGQQPGSAPGETLYWFEDVLVSLATDLDDREWLETHVAKVVKYGLWFGKKSFEAVITDLLFVVLLDVQVKDGKTNVRHTMPMQLFPMNRSDHLSTHPSERPPRTEKDTSGQKTSQPPSILIDRSFPPQGGQDLLSSSTLYESEANLTKYIPGFIALQNFMHKAKNRAFDREGVSRGVLPTEILSRVADFFDYDTHMTSMEANGAFRAYGLRYLWIHGFTMLERVEFPKGEGEEEGKVEGPVITFADSETCEEKRFLVYRNSSQKAFLTWCPVVGEGDRRSAMSRVGQRFTAV